METPSVFNHNLLKSLTGKLEIRQAKRKSKLSGFILTNGNADCIPTYCADLSELVSELQKLTGLSMNNKD